MDNVLIQVREKAQITLPAKVRKAFGVKQGDYLEVKMAKKGILLSPKAIFDKIPSVELSKTEEKELKKALKEVKQGKTKEFKNVEELIKDLDS